MKITSHFLHLQDKNANNVTSQSFITNPSKNDRSKWWNLYLIPAIKYHMALTSFTRLLRPKTLNSQTKHWRDLNRKLILFLIKPSPNQVKNWKNKSVIGITALLHSSLTTCHTCYNLTWYFSPDKNHMLHRKLCFPYCIDADPHGIIIWYILIRGTTELHPNSILA